MQRIWFKSKPRLKYFRTLDKVWYTRVSYEYIMIMLNNQYIMIGYVVAFYCDLCILWNSIMLRRPS